MVNGKTRNAYQLSEEHLRQMDVGQMLQGIRHPAGRKSTGIPVTFGIAGFDENGNPEFVSANGYYTDIKVLKDALQSKPASQRMSLEEVMSGFDIYANHHEAMQADSLYAKKTKDAEANGELREAPVDVVSAGRYTGGVFQKQKEPAQTSDAKFGKRGSESRKDAPGEEDGKKTQQASAKAKPGKKRKGFQDPEAAMGEKLRKAVDDTVKQYETRDAARDLQAGKDKQGSGGKSPVNIDIRQEMQRMMVRQMLMEMSRNLTSGDLVHTIGYVGGAFLMLRHCGGVKENLSQAFHLQAGMFEQGPLKKFADTCRKAGPKDRIPYDPLCAAVDSVGLDMALQTAMHDPDRTAKSMHTAKSTYDRRQNYIFERMGEDGVDPETFIRERQKVICQSILEDPDRASFYGIEIGDDNWNEIVKQCHAKVHFEPSNPGEFKDIRTVVDFYEMPAAGVCKADGSPWFDGMEGRELQINMPPDGLAGFESRAAQHQASLDKWCGPDEIRGIARAMNTKPPLSAMQQDLAQAARLKSRFAMMGEQGFLQIDMEDAWEVHLEKTGMHGGFDRTPEQSGPDMEQTGIRVRPRYFTGKSPGDVPFWDENAFDGISPAENVKKQDAAAAKRAKKAETEMDIAEGQKPSRSDAEKRLEEEMGRILHNEEEDKGSYGFSK